MDDVVLITPPASEPITVQNLKDHAKIFTAVDDTYISTFIIPAARMAVEDEMRRVLITQTWLLKRDSFPGFDPRYESNYYPTILLPKPPAQKIISFTYVDVAGVTQTLTEAGPDGVMPLVGGADPFYGYQFDRGSETQPGRLIPPWARPWPPARRIPSAVQIQFQAGFGPILDNSSPPNVTWKSGNGLPAAILQALLLQGAHLYYNREAITADGGKELARGVSTLLAPYRNEIA